MKKYKLSSDWVGALYGKLHGQMLVKKHGFVSRATVGHQKSEIVRIVK